jgi:LDH2 family malate/lactate/ureidoglycolate dehydrogenase
MIIVLDATKFLPPDEYGAAMDAFVGEAMKLGPIEGTERAELPGGDQARLGEDSDDETFSRL